MTNNIKWIYYVSKRLSRVDRKGRGRVTSTLASLGVCFGVMALIVVMSVMNGFQRSYIDAIMEISSYHLRAENVDKQEVFLSWCTEEKNVLSVTPFYEAQGLMVGAGGRQAPALVRAVPSDVLSFDAGLKKEAKVVSGSFNLAEDDSIVLGYSLARSLGVTVGSTVNILALSGSTDVALLSQKRIFKVTGIFYSGYSDINSSYAFINLDSGKKHFGQGSSLVYGLKIKDSEKDAAFISKARHDFYDVNFTSWRQYNRSFFGALRVEKNILMLLVFLIFVVVAVNIYNGMRRIVFERKEEIAVLSALGGTKGRIQSVFVLQGLVTGIKGAVPGLLLGLFLCVNIKQVFSFVSKIQYYAQCFFVSLFSPESASYLSENMMYAVYGDIPARMYSREILLIFFFGVFSSLLASFLASSSVLKATVAEVLKNE